MVRKGQPIVVGIDGTDAGWRALEWALTRADDLQCPLRVVHVCGLDTALLPFAEHADDERRRQCEAVVLEARRRIGAEGGVATVELAVDEGRPSNALQERADGVRELVVGRRAMGPVERFFVGSTSRAVIAHASLPVVVVPQHGRTPERREVVVGVDGSRDSQAAVEYAFSFASHDGASVVAVGAWDVPLPAYGEALGTELDWWRNDAQLSAAESLAGWSEKFPDVPVHTEVVQGHPVRVLAQRAEGAQLVVVGGRGRSTLRGRYLGSTAEGLARHASCPVAVVHQPAG